MDLAAPYRAVVPSLDGPVLRVLASTTRPLSGLEVHRLAAAGSSSGVRKVLGRLVAQGLATVFEAGPSLLYTANREHLAWPAVQSLMTMRQRLFESMAMDVGGWQVQPVLVGVFGSAARGDGRASSDVDLLVVRPDDVGDVLALGTGGQAGEWASQVQSLRDGVHQLTGNRAHVVEFSAEDFASTLRSGEPIVEHWRRDLVRLAGPSPWPLATVEPRPGVAMGAPAS